MKANARGDILGCSSSDVRFGHLQAFRIPVAGQHKTAAAQLRQLARDGSGVPAQPRGCVQIHAVRFERQVLQALVEHDRRVHT